MTWRIPARLMPDAHAGQALLKASAVPIDVPSLAHTDAGQAVYTRPDLAAYDLFVLRFANRLVWRCPWRCLLAHYDRHVSANHLDVGVDSPEWSTRGQVDQPIRAA